MNLHKRFESTLSWLHRSDITSDIAPKIRLLHRMFDGSGVNKERNEGLASSSERETMLIALSSLLYHSGTSNRRTELIFVEFPFVHQVHLRFLIKKMLLRANNFKGGADDSLSVTGRLKFMKQSISDGKLLFV